MCIRDRSSTAPDFEAQWVGGDNDGETFKLSDLQGKVVVLDLMATTCSPCKDIADDMLTPLHEKQRRPRRRNHFTICW